MKSKGPSERSIQEACDDLLTLDGWRIIKTDLPHLRGLGVQEKGMPDRLYLRYLARPCIGHGCSGEQCGPTEGVKAQALWIEWKRLKQFTGKRGDTQRPTKPAEHQTRWHIEEMARGAFVVVAGRTFPASVEGFLDWYNGSGLARRKLSLAKYPTLSGLRRVLGVVRPLTAAQTGKADESANL